MVATGMAVSSASRILNKEPKLFGLIKTVEKQHENSRTYKLWHAARKSDTWVTTWSKDGNTSNPLSPWLADKLPRKQNETYPHAIVFDFESYQDKTKASNPTRDLSYESEHVPISVSIADTINTEPEYICSNYPDELISLCYQSLVQRQRILKEDVEERYLPSDLEYLPNKQQNLIKQWCGQVPVIGYNSGRYDLPFFCDLL